MSFATKVCKKRDGMFFFLKIYELKPGPRKSSSGCLGAPLVHKDGAKIDLWPGMV